MTNGVYVWVSHPIYSDFFFYLSRFPEVCTNWIRLIQSTTVRNIVMFTIVKVKEIQQIYIDDTVVTFYF